MTPKPTRRSALLVLAAGVAAGLAGCGRKSDLEPPAGAETSFPRGYPPGAKPDDKKRTQ